MYISNLAKYKLLHKESRKYEGYRLTYLGYDFLAIHSLVKKGVINSVGRQIGVGKESDVFEVSKVPMVTHSCNTSHFMPDSHWVQNLLTCSTSLKLCGMRENKCCDCAQ